MSESARTELLRTILEHALDLASEAEPRLPAIRAQLRVALVMIGERDVTSRVEVRES